jgi:hypothetical protein
MLLVRRFGLVLLLTARRRIDPKPLVVPKGKSSNRSCSLRIVNTGVTAGSPISIQFVGGVSYCIPVLYFKARNGPLSLQIKQLRENSTQCEFKGDSIRVQPIIRLPQRPTLAQVKCMDEHRITMAEFSSRLSQRSANPRPVPREVLVWQVSMAHFISFNHLLESGR